LLSFSACCRLGAARCGAHLLAVRLNGSARTLRHSPFTDCPTSTPSRGRARPDLQSDPAPCASANDAVGDGLDPVRSDALPSRALTLLCIRYPSPSFSSHFALHF
jgi:hypothetical protein